jgi:hypothetical protein
MEITTDIALRSTAWDQAIDALSPLFKPRSQYSIYMLALSIGIMYDRRIASDEDYRHSVPRNVLQNNDNGKLDFMFQAAILSTTTESFTEDERLELAFGEKTDFKKIEFLTQFANFGVTKLVEHIGASPIESMENIKNFLCSTVEGNNFDIDALPDDLLTEEM